MKRTHVSVIDIQHTHTHMWSSAVHPSRIGSDRVMPDMFHYCRHSDVRLWLGVERVDHHRPALIGQWGSEYRTRYPTYTRTFTGANGAFAPMERRLWDPES
jgi:hypothetical protein